MEESSEINALGKGQEYCLVLQALREIPFPVGRKFLCEFLQGVVNQSVRRFRLQGCASFGSLAYNDEEVHALIDMALSAGLIEQGGVRGNQFMKVFTLTELGERELAHPGSVVSQPQVPQTRITDQEREVFSALSFFLDGLDDEQKKAVVCARPHILCVAGAGSGKTSVLIRRIECLMRFRSVPAGRILAVTFTRKARAEMAHRLRGAGDRVQGGHGNADYGSASAGIHGDEVHIETFNSFCEKILRADAKRAYGRDVRVISQREKAGLVEQALADLSLDMPTAIERYFSSREKREKEFHILASVFVNDCFTVRDFFRAKSEPVSDFSRGAQTSDDEVRARMVYQVCAHIDEKMREFGLRDYTDQVMDVLDLFRRHPDVIPRFDHVLIDEFQDVNAAQVELVRMLAAPNVFCVGDPRQSIYGWRGSRIQYISSFAQHFADAEIVYLTNNYRSVSSIVMVANGVIKPMGLPDLRGVRQEPGRVRLIRFGSDMQEHEFVARAIRDCGVPPGEIFVLARTNRQVLDAAAVMRAHGIACVVRTDDSPQAQAVRLDAVLLATVHSIKGMQARLVFLIDCTNTSFPCRATDHPVIRMLRFDEYDEEEEERRLLYVAMSRAKDELVVTYHGNLHSKFITPQVRKIMQFEQVDLSAREAQETSQTQASVKVAAAKGSGRLALARLSDWRLGIARARQVHPSLILDDATMLRIIDARPATLDELGAVEGMNPVRLKHYGEQILDVIQ